jgi:hypothetical protein
MEVARHLILAQRTVNRCQALVAEILLTLQLLELPAQPAARLEMILESLIPRSLPRQEMEIALVPLLILHSNRVQTQPLQGMAVEVPHLVLPQSQAEVLRREETAQVPPKILPQCQVALPLPGGNPQLVALEALTACPNQAVLETTPLVLPPMQLTHPLQVMPAPRAILPVLATAIPQHQLITVVETTHQLSLHQQTEPIAQNRTQR